MKRRMLAVVLVLMMCFSGIVFTAKANTTEKDVVLTKEQAILLAEKWQEKNYDEDVQIDNIIPIYDSLNTISAYSIGFTDGEEDKGYVVINTDLSQDMVRQFALSGKDLYDRTIGISQGKNEILLERKMFESGPFKYVVRGNKNGIKVYFDGGQAIDKEKFENGFAEYKEIKNEIKEKGITTRSTPLGNFIDAIQYEDDGLFDGLTVATSYRIFVMDEIQENAESGEYIYPFTQSQFVQPGDSYANCAPTALTNIMGYYFHAWEYTSILQTPRTGVNYLHATYDAIVEESGYDRTTGGLSLYEVSSGIRGYILHRTPYYSAVNTFSNNSWSNYIFELGLDCPIYTSMAGFLYTGQNWDPDSHGVVAVGYKTFTNGTKYLNVLTGHDPYFDAYINFNDPYFSRELYGIVVGVV